MRNTKLLFFILGLFSLTISSCDASGKKSYVLKPGEKAEIVIESDKSHWINWSFAPGSNSYRNSKEEAGFCKPNCGRIRAKDTGGPTIDGNFSATIKVKPVNGKVEAILENISSSEFEFMVEHKEAKN